MLQRSGQNEVFSVFKNRRNFDHCSFVYVYTFEEVLSLFYACSFVCFPGNFYTSVVSVLFPGWFDRKICQHP